MRATRADVAQRAGVSVATVSYVLNNTCPVKDETRRKVLAAARALNYVPDMRARSMATNRTMQLGVIVSSLTDPVNSEIVERFIHRAAKNGYFVNVSSKNGSIRENIRNIISQHVDGVFILSVPDDIETDMIYHLTDTEIKAVIGAPLRDDSNRQQVCTIELDMEDAFDNALSYLYNCGHRSVVHISCEADDVQQRMLPRYQQLSRQKNRPHVEFLTNSIEYDTYFDTGHALARQLLNKKGWEYTAVLTSNDPLAHGGMAAFLERGRRVPEEISFLSLMSSAVPYFSPLPLTSMVADYRKYAEKAFDQLQDFIDGNLITHQRIPFQLKEGKTVQLI